MINRDLLKLFGYEINGQRMDGSWCGWDHEVWYHDPSDTWVHFGKHAEVEDFEMCSYWDNFYMQINGEKIDDSEFIRLHIEHNSNKFTFSEDIKNKLGMVA